MGGKVLIIAEAGINHNGSLALAEKLVDQAKTAGADIVKFQTATPERLVSRHARMADYQMENTGRRESQLEMLKRLQLSREAFEELAAYCKSKGITFLSTPFDLESIDFLRRLGMPFWKIPSGEITNKPYLIKIARTGMPVVMSTGMSTLEEVAEAVGLLEGNGAGRITLLHCNTQYPTPYSDVNLNAMLTLRARFGLDVGYSDHTLGIEIPAAAVALGAIVIEKHFTLDRGMEGPDHKASLEPVELAAMVNAVRHVEAAMGDGEKAPSASELPNRDVARKSIVAKRPIRRGEIFTEQNLTAKRPGTGISPMRWDEVLGRRAERDFAEDDLIEMDV